MKELLMIRYFKPGCAFTLMLVFLQATFAQIPADIKETISRKFINYCKEVPRQEIFVHTDRQTYMAGEDIWFNIYLFDRRTNQPQIDEKIAYIEVLNSENRPVVQKRMLLDKGSCPGQFSLPDTLSSGTYTLRAYTSWMKNFMPENCFMKDISVYNAFTQKAFIKKTYPEPDIITSTVNKTTLLSDDIGLVLDVNNMMPENLELVITTNNRYRSENKSIFYLFIQTHGLINQFSSERAIGEKTVLIIPKNLLGQGINHITIFDAGGRPLRERLIYTPEKQFQEIALDVSSSFNSREKISLELELSKDLVKELSMNKFSISVSPDKFCSNSIELSDYMLFGSEFGIYPLEFLKSGSLSELSYSKIDSLLLLLKSNWIDWGRVLSDENVTMKYKHETEYHYLSGRLISKNSQKSDSGKFVFMSIPGKVAQFQYAKTDANAGFDLKVGIDDILKDLVIQPGDPENIASTKLESSFSERYILSNQYTDETESKPAIEITRLSTNYQVNKIYLSTSVGAPVVQKDVLQIKPKRFYGKPDISLVMDDYIKLPVMEEVFFELLPGANLKKRKNVYEITIFDPIDNKMFNNPPCLMVDGVIIYNPSVIADLDPEIVEKIDLVKEKYYIGDNLFYGIVNVISRSGDFNSVTLPGYATRLQYKVYESPVTFTSPDYSSIERKSSRIPDFRNTLYWNPAVQSDKEGKARIEFWSSDYKSNYIIDIQGITSSGKVVSLRKIIKVM
jgi:hypothetical protein